MFATTFQNIAVELSMQILSHMLLMMTTGDDPACKILLLLQHSLGHIYPWLKRLAAFAKKKLIATQALPLSSQITHTLFLLLTVLLQSV